MDREPSEKIKELIRELIDNEIKLLEDRIMSSVVATFSRIETQQETRHSENRTRTQFLDTKVTEVKAQNEGIMRSQEIIQDSQNETQSLVRSLIEKVSREEGIKQGLEKAEQNHDKRKEKRNKILIGIAGMIPISFIAKWLAGFFHVNIGGK